MGETLASLFWATFGMGYTEGADLDDRYLSLNRDPPLIRTHTSHHGYTAVFGYTLLWTYIFSAVVVMLNLLIAMMSNSFQEIYVSIACITIEYVVLAAIFAICQLTMFSLGLIFYVFNAIFCLDEYIACKMNVDYNSQQCRCLQPW